MTSLFLTGEIAPAIKIHANLVKSIRTPLKLQFMNESNLEDDDFTDI